MGAFDDDEPPSKPRRHSLWADVPVAEAVRVGQAAGVKQLLLFHHDPIHDDKQMALIERALKKVFPGGAVAREGMEIKL